MYVLYAVTNWFATICEVTVTVAICYRTGQCVQAPILTTAITAITIAWTGGITITAITISELAAITIMISITVTSITTVVSHRCVNLYWAGTGLGGPLLCMRSPPGTVRLHASYG